MRILKSLLIVLLLSSSCYAGGVRITAGNSIKIDDADSSNSVGFDAPAVVTTDQLYTLPDADGTTGQILITDGSGNLSWATGGGDVSAAANITDNSVVRGDGGAKGVQDSGVLIDDSDNVTGVTAFTATTINAFSLGGKLTGAANEIEGSNFDINAGTVDAITSLTVANSVDIGAYVITADGFAIDNDNVWLSLGTGNDGQIGVTGDDVVIKNVTTDADIRLWTSDGGTPELVQHIHGDTGIVDLPEQSAARAYITVNQTISTGTWTKIWLDTRSYDVQSEFTLYTDDLPNQARFTATKAGYYLVTAKVYYVSPEADKGYAASLQKNGAIYTLTNVHTSHTSSCYVPISDIIPLAVGDYVELFTYHGAVGDEAVNAGATVTFMAIHKLS